MTIVQAAVGPEGGLPFVSFLYLDVVEAPSTSSFVKYLAPRSFAISSGISRSGFFTVMAFKVR